MSKFAIRSAILAPISTARLHVAGCEPRTRRRRQPAPAAADAADNPDSRRPSSSPAPAAPTAPSPTARCRSTSSAPRRSPTPARPRPTGSSTSWCPSFNFPQPSIADGSDALRPATLRGLSPDQTLVLVNGKRRHVSALLNINGTVGRGSAAADLNLIPGLAISRIEVLRDGAVVAIWLGRHRRRDQHPAQERQPRRPRQRHLRQVYHDHRQCRRRHRPADQRRRPADARSRPTPATSSPTPTATARRATGPRSRAAVNFGFPLGAARLYQPHRRISLSRADQPRRLRPPAQLSIRPTDRVRPARADLQPPPVPVRRPARRAITICSSTAGFEFGGGWELYAFGSYGHRNSESAANWRQQNNGANRDLEHARPRTRRRTTPISCR